MVAIAGNAAAVDEVTGEDAVFMGEVSLPCDVGVVAAEAAGAVVLIVVGMREVRFLAALIRTFTVDGILQNGLCVSPFQRI